MKPFNKIKNSVGRNLFVFDHGLGDLIHYLPVHKEFEKQVGHKVQLTSPTKRQYHKLCSDIISYETIDSKGYSYIYKLYYPDTQDYKPPFEYHTEPSKPYICAYTELGMKEFSWSPYKIHNEFFNKKSKRIGVHFFGHTGVNEKFCPNKVAEIIWGEISNLGYEPFECHMRPDFRSNYKDCGNDECFIIPKESTLRYQQPDLSVMKEEIGKCRFFIGVDAGPLYLAGSLLGYNRIIGLENLKRISYYCPKPFQKVSVREYLKGKITKIIKRMEAAL
jgi:hypothetical protein